MLTLTSTWPAGAPPPILSQIERPRPESGSPRRKSNTPPASALALLPIGLSHFVYVNETAQMVPAWLPARTGLAYLTGAGHAAAGLGLLFSIVPRLAATLEAVMMSSFVLLIHIPAVAHAPTDRLQWTMLSVATALAGSAWTVAGSFTRVRTGTNR